MSERKAFKDYFDTTAALELGTLLTRGVPGLDVDEFATAATKGTESLEMMDRVRRTSAAMRGVLPSEPRAAYAAVVKSLPDPLPSCDNVTDGYVLWPVGEFLAETCAPGMTKAEVRSALDCMEQYTQRFSAEFAVRPFAEQYPEIVLPRLLQLTRHSSAHVRRWCSEGVRSRLPWGKRLALETSEVIEILDQLKADPELYVQKSVANNLNDVAKDDPQLVLEVCARWLENGSEPTQWIVRHALRSLIKAGDPGALALMGYSAPVDLGCTLTAVPAKLEIGESSLLSLRIENQAKQEQRLLVDYRVHYVKARGSANAKVFKWKEVVVEPGAVVELSKNQAFRHVSIRRLHSGDHLVDVQINGVVCAETTIALQ